MKNSDAKGKTLIEVKRRRAPFVTRLLAWADLNTRFYPWRLEERSPYEVMLAEILLKRTTATSATNAYARVLEKYPTLARLAMATEHQLTLDLTPLGLQAQRASSLVRLANYLMEYEYGMVPCSLERLLKVPGLGDYSARAVLSFACDVPVAVVDANIERIFRRVFLCSIPDPVRSLMRAIAECLLPERFHRKYNFALLDLGAMVCKYERPQCNECPLLSLCDFQGSDIGMGEQSTDLGSKLRTVRQAQKTSLAKLARRAGVSKLTIVNIEAGRVHPLYGTVRKLANALDVPVTALIETRKPVKKKSNARRNHGSERRAAATKL